jgi:Bacterial protein of unknown function (DUF937)
MPTLLETLSASFDPDTIGSIARALGADSSAVGKGIGAIGPMLISSMARTASTPGGADALTRLLPQDSGSLLGNLSSMLSGLLGGTGAAGGGLVNQLLGSGANAMGASLSRALGFNIMPLLGMATPALLGVVAKTMKSQNLDAGGLASLLKTESTAFAANPANAEAMALVNAASDAGDKAAATIASYGAEWTKVSLGAAAATMLVAGSDLSGPLGTMKEAKAAGEALQSMAQAAGPASIISAAFGGGLSTDMLMKLRELDPTKDKLVDIVASGAKAVAARSPAEAAAYKATILKVAQATAEASKDGGFLGIGGTLVSSDEQSALDAIKAALA